MADATDSKSVVRKDVWVQVPPPVLFKAGHRVGFAIGRPLGAVSKTANCYAHLLGAGLKNAALCWAGWPVGAVPGLPPFRARARGLQPSVPRSV